MALGNWDTFVVNEKGELIEGIFKHNSIVVKIHKSWVYIEDEKSWSEDCHFAKPTVMEIEEGLINYKGIRIVAKRKDEYNSLYFAIWISYSGEEDMEGIFGVATYCYDGSEYVGVRGFQKDNFKKFIKEGQNWEFYTPDILDKIKEFNSYNQGDAYIIKHLVHNKERG